MKILVIAHYQSDGSPTAIFVHDQVKAFKKLGQDVVVLVPVALGKAGYRGSRTDTGVSEEVIDGVRHYFVRFLSLSKYGEKSFNSRSAIRSIRRNLLKTIKAFDPDVIQAHTFGVDSDIAVWLKSVINKPAVVTTHGSDTNIPYEKGLKDKLRHRCENVDAIACVGSKLKARLEDCNIGVEPVVIHNGFNGELVSEGVPQKPHSFIQVGNLVPSKNFDVTIKAFSIIKERLKDATLTIVGRGPEFDGLVSLRDSLGLEDSVRFTGQLENEEVLKLMAGSEFYVMVSSPEGFGIVYLEAMASRCLTIGTENEGISDVIQSGVNGVLLPPGSAEDIADAVFYYVDHPAEMERIVQNGKATADEYTWENNVMRYLDLFRRVTSK